MFSWWQATQNQLGEYAMDENKRPVQFVVLREGDICKGETEGIIGSPNVGFPNVASPKGGKGALQEDIAQKASRLNLELRAFEKEILQRQNQGAQIPFVLVAKLCLEEETTSYRRAVANLFQTKMGNQVIGINAVNELLVRVESLEAMEIIASRLRDFKRHKFGISCLMHFAAYEPKIEFEKGRRNYKVKLLDFQSSAENAGIQERFEKDLAAKGIWFKKIYYTDSVVRYHIQEIDDEALDLLKGLDTFAAVFSMEPMPQFKMNLNLYKSSDNRQVVLCKPDRERDYVTVGVLDSGIARIPHLDPWLEERRWTPYSDSQMNVAHGTFVAGIVVYGDAFENQDWVGHAGVKLFDAAIYPDTSSRDIYEDELIGNIRRVIEENHQDIRIWNLSISIKRPAKDSEASDFALALDALQEKYPILICKSSGNGSNFMSGKPKGRIYAGADSVRSLVVGSLAHEKNESDLAEVDNPSPFTRVGPGPGDVVKPEIVHYGGNVGVDDAGRLTVNGVRSFAPDGSRSSTVGTSFSAARVTSLAAGVSQKLAGEFDPLLVKTLLIHSAVYPAGLTIPRKERVKQVGFGLPKAVVDIVYNTPFEATLILRERLVQGEYVNITDFPLPACLVKEGYYTGQITVTVVHDPILDPTQGAEYCQSDLDIQLGSHDGVIAAAPQGNTSHQLGLYGAKNLLPSSVYSEQKENANQREANPFQEQLPVSYGDDYRPVKKYVLHLSELAEENRRACLSGDKRWFLALQGRFRDSVERKAELEQKKIALDFCLVITIRDPLGKAPVYRDVSRIMYGKTKNSKGSLY